ncbi:MAG: RNA methyltransferase [Victivallaceae bacterium]
MSALTKKQEALIKALYTRHGRKKYDLCVCEGARCCSEVLAASPQLIEFTVCADSFTAELGLTDEIIRLDDSEFMKLSSTISSQGILMVVRKPEPVASVAVPADDFLFVLDRVGDPGNFGTILRTAKAAGLTEVWYTTGSVDPFSDKVIRSAMAAQFSLTLREYPDLDALASAALSFSYRRFYLTDPHCGANCFTEKKLYDKSVIIIGSEAHGAGALAGAEKVMIPMPGNFESLNAAQAATIFLFEYVRRNSMENSSGI